MDQSSPPGIPGTPGQSSGGSAPPSKIRHAPGLPGLGQPAAVPRQAPGPATVPAQTPPKQGAAPRQPGQPGQPGAPGASAATAVQPQRQAAPSDEDAALSPVKMVAGDNQSRKEIRAFGGLKRHEDQWSRKPTVTGTGAIHVKTFHGKLTEDALVFMDKQINEWLDAHPEYEVKFISSTIGEFSSKIKEPNLICQVWV